MWLFELFANKLQLFPLLPKMYFKMDKPWNYAVYMKNVLILIYITETLLKYYTFNNPFNVKQVHFFVYFCTDLKQLYEKNCSYSRTRIVKQQVNFSETHPVA